MAEDKIVSERYATVSSNWYKQFPYTFRWRKTDTESSYFNLPISPNNIQINTHFATAVIPTMYGTIEEHSEQRYFDISIIGTTGMTPSYYEKYAKAGAAKPGEGRSGFTIDVNASPESSFFRKTRSLIDKIQQQYNEAKSSSESKAVSAVKNDQSGYVAFHNFYKFLLEYKDNVALGKKPKSGHPLSFFNYKDNNAYDVSITNFSMTRDSSNPLLYNYNITMKAYNLRSIDEAIKPASLDLGKFGLDGLNTTAFANISNKIRAAKNTAYGVISAFKSIGL